MQEFLFPQRSEPERVQSVMLNQSFLKFVQVATVRLKHLVYLNLVVELTQDQDQDLSLGVLHGADSAFDDSVHVLATVAKHVPKIMIDNLMFWRKQTTETDESIPNDVIGKYHYLGSREVHGIVRERRSVSHLISLYPISYSVEHSLPLLTM
jgi:hypothetical protein